MSQAGRLRWTRLRLRVCWPTCLCRTRGSAGWPSTGSSPRYGLRSDPNIAVQLRFQKRFQQSHGSWNQMALQPRYAPVFGSGTSCCSWRLISVPPPRRRHLGRFLRPSRRRSQTGECIADRPAHVCLRTYLHRTWLTVAARTPQPENPRHLTAVAALGGRRGHGRGWQAETETGRPGAALTARCVATGGTAACL